METELQPHMLFISNVSPGVSFANSTELFSDLEKILHLRKRSTSKKLDNIQMDFCQFQPYVQYKGYLDRLDPQQTIVVNWMPACRMPFHMTTHVPFL